MSPSAVASSSGSVFCLFFSGAGSVNVGLFCSGFVQWTYSLVHTGGVGIYNRAFLELYFAVLMCLGQWLSNILVIMAVLCSSGFAVVYTDCQVITTYSGIARGRDFDVGY